MPGQKTDTLRALLKLSGRLQKQIDELSSGFVTGPATSTDNAIALFDGITGDQIKESVVEIDGSGNLTNVGLINGIDITTIAANLTVYYEQVSFKATTHTTDREILQISTSIDPGDYLIIFSLSGKNVRRKTSTITFQVDAVDIDEQSYDFVNSADRIPFVGATVQTLGASSTVTLQHRTSSGGESSIYDALAIAIKIG